MNHKADPVPEGETTFGIYVLLVRAPPNQIRYNFEMFENCRKKELKGCVEVGAVREEFPRQLNMVVAPLLSFAFEDVEFAPSQKSFIQITFWIIMLIQLWQQYLTCCDSRVCIP